MAELTYPNEIPWKHLVTSQDMMDTNITDREFPLKWKSSMAFFYYKPKLEEEVLSGRKILFLKVVCSITGYQVDNNELGVDVKNPKEWDSRVYQNFNELIQDYYPCYGALLHLAVFPHKEDDLKRYPYIIDFEPKKREMFEVVTETGEIMSRSLHSLKVNTGGTSTSSMETIDVDKGWSLKGDVNVKDIGGGSLQLGSNYESGYKALVQGQNVNLRQIDASQEAKETLSHTTELQQMYQLLDSYHLGTNRALFVIQPRPHIVDQEFSVTNGPRRLEGIQEFFFIVSMPADSKGLCVVGQLETSHLHKKSRTETTTPEIETGDITQTIRDSYKGGVWSNYTTRRYPILVPGGYIVDRSKGNGGYIEQVRSGDDVTEDIETHQVFVYDDRIEVEVIYDPGPWPDTAYFTADYTVYYRSPEKPEPVTTTVTEIDLFMTGRYLQGCLDVVTDKISVKEPKHPWLDEFIIYEEILPGKYCDVYNEIPKLSKQTEVAGNIKQLLNELQSFIHDRSLASVNSPNRYPAGQHTILDTDFALRTISSAPGKGHYKASDYTTTIKVDDSLINKMDGKAAKDIMRFSRADLLRSNSSQMAQRTGLKIKDVLMLKKSNLKIPTKRK